MLRCSTAILLVLAATSRRCPALSPLLHGSPAGAAHDGAPPPAPRSEHGLRDAPPRGRRPPRTAARPLSLAGGGAFSPEPEGPPRQNQGRQRWAEYVVAAQDVGTPIVTQKAPSSVASMPARPKIVVFGASGRIGRRIVKRLLSSGADVDVVAFVRDAEKLERVLYDEEDVVLGNLLEGDNGGRGRGGPRLQVVVSNVVSRRDLCQGDFETVEEKRALDLWVDKARGYFAGRGWTTKGNFTEPAITKSFRNSGDEQTVASDVDALQSGGEEALRDAVAGASVLVSCLAAFRPSDLWTDYLRVPVVRIFRRDASRWSSDPTHPYYVNYLSTKKILDEAEREQGRRDAALEALEEERKILEARENKEGKREEEGFESEIAERLAELRESCCDASRGGNGIYNEGDDPVSLPREGQLPSSADRIKFIRISHLMVGHSPFRIWSVLTNILWSQLSRYELMGEMLMESSGTVDTIVLRPGELTDDERVSSHTSLQLCIDGTVRYPSVVGRDDIADLAVVSALTKTCLNGTESSWHTVTDGGSGNYPSLIAAAHHYTWAVRWAGQHLSPPQGLRPDGLPSAALCFVKAMKEQLRADARRRRREGRMRSYHGGEELLRLRQWGRRRIRPFAQSLAVSVPLYATMGLLGWHLFGQTLMEAFLRLRRLKVAQIFLKLLPS